MAATVLYTVTQIAEFKWVKIVAKYGLTKWRKNPLVPISIKVFCPIKLTAGDFGIRVANNITERVPNIAVITK